MFAKTLWIALAILSRAAAAICAKKAALSPTGFPELLLSPWYAAMLAALFLQAVWWILALRSVPLSVAYPFMSLVIVLNLTSAALIFGEPVYVHQMAGAGFILAGVVLIGARPERPERPREA